MSRKNHVKQRIGSLLHDSLFYDPRVNQLSKDAFILLIEAVMMENNYNNGDLALANGTLNRKWRKQTLIKARQELEDMELIHLERRGFFGKPNLYSSCHKPVNDIPMKGICGTTRARRRAEGIHPKKANGVQKRPP